MDAAHTQPALMSTDEAAEAHRIARRFFYQPTTEYDYRNQAWVVNGVYAPCAHSKPCATCFGTLHAGEAPDAANTEVY